MPDFGKSIFICSKPLQLLNCCSIMREYNLYDTEVHLVTTGIHDHKNFINFIKNSNHFNQIKNIIEHQNHLKAAEAIKTSNYKSLFIESDLVSLYHVLAPLKRKYLSVFEEGFGTYVYDSSKIFKGLKKIKWQILSLITGCGLRFGEGRKTDFVLVQYPEIYKALNPKKNKTILPIPGILDEIEQDLPSWEKALTTEIGSIVKSSETANFILGSWGGFPTEYTSQIKNKSLKTYYKAHPHDGDGFKNGNAETIKNAWIPAEACISILSKKYAQLEVYHLSSSTAFYCENKYKNVIFHDLLKYKSFTELMQQKMKKNNINI